MAYFMEEVAVLCFMEEMAALFFMKEVAVLLSMAEVAALLSMEEVTALLFMEEVAEIQLLLAGPAADWDGSFLAGMKKAPGAKPSLKKLICLTDLVSDGSLKNVVGGLFSGLETWRPVETKPTRFWL